jgi:Stress responsive A/B Barrel Domain
MQFETKEDRDYYVHKDPVHLAFAKGVVDKVDGVRVLDFEDGIF